MKKTKKEFLVTIKMDTKLCLLLLLSAHLFAGKIFIYYSFISFDYTYILYICTLCLCYLHLPLFEQLHLFARFPFFLICHPIVILVCVIRSFSYSNFERKFLVIIMKTDYTKFNILQCLNWSLEIGHCFYI